jgi:hypothetical protein
LYSANNSTLTSGEGSRGRGLGGRVKARPAKGKGEGVRGNARSGKVHEGTDTSREREEGTLHRRSVALLSYTSQKPKVAQTHTWDSSKITTHSSLPINTFTNIPTSLNQTHEQYFQLKKKFLNTI